VQHGNLHIQTVKFVELPSSGNVDLLHPGIDDQIMGFVGIRSAVFQVGIGRTVGCARLAEQRVVGLLLRLLGWLGLVLRIHRLRIYRRNRVDLMHLVRRLLLQLVQLLKW